MKSFITRMFPSKTLSPMWKSKEQKNLVNLFSRFLPSVFSMICETTKSFTITNSDEKVDKTSHNSLE